MNNNYGFIADSTANSDEQFVIPLEEDLQKMTAEDLIAFEDALLLENETTSNWRVRAAGGRFVVMVLGILCWGILFFGFSLMARAFNEELSGILSLVFVPVTGILGVMLANKIWSSVGTNLRNLIRNLLHYWPVVLILLLLIPAFFRG